MKTLSSFELLERIHHSRNSSVFRCRSTATGESVILKLLEDPYPPPEKIAWFRREFETTARLAEVSGVVDAYDLRYEEDRWFIVLEDFGGSALTKEGSEIPMAMGDLLEVALSISRILGQVHQNHIIHKDVNPSNIVRNPEDGRIKLIDFGISTVLSRETPALRDPSKLEGTLAYLSPEQTGRTSRSLDHRTDFYSLGVTLYELATGRLPFESSDPLELIHAHVARRPQPPHELNPELDPTLSRILMKLLAKNAEDRYQSAYGLVKDLEALQGDLHAGQPPGLGELGESDISERFQIPQKLYGRQDEIKVLRQAFERTAKGGSAAVMVSGYSGIGKTVLIQTLYGPVTGQRGYFASGKFEQLKRDEPYAPLVQAFRGLILQILSESEEQLEGWRAELSRALAVNARVLVEVIPELELLLGPQAPVPKLDSRETRNRFHLVLKRFINVFCGSEHPLVLFVDDLQWVDTASLDLLLDLMAGQDNHHLLFIGAFRDNEVTDLHPLSEGIRHLRSMGVLRAEIVLRPLARDEVEALLGDALGRDDAELAELADLILAKTGGNPFFLNEFLKELFAEGCLRFRPETGAWTWSLEVVSARGMTDNVVDLMAAKVRRLGPALERTLELAACIGNRFQLRSLAVVSEKKAGEVARDLEPALKEGLILPMDDRYKLLGVDVEGLWEELDLELRFAHDRIQQAAYSLIEEEERRRIHWQVGQLLLASIGAEELERKSFDVVHQLNHGLEFARSAGERDQLASLNLAAGKRAKTSAAYSAAYHYFQTGLGLLAPPEFGFPGRLPGPEEVAASFQRAYPLSLELCEAGAEAACLTGAFKDTQHLLEILRQHAKTELDRLGGDRIEIQAYAAQDLLMEGLDAGLASLSRLGIDIPRQPAPADIERAAKQALEAWRGRSIADLIELPDMEDPRELAAMDIMARLYVSTYNGAPLVFLLIVFNEILLSIKSGVCQNSPRGFIAYGFILCTEGRVEEGHAFGRLASHLAERFENRDKSSTIYMFNFFVRHWSENLSRTLDGSFEEGYRAGLDAGDLEFAGLNLSGVIGQGVWSGKDLNEVAELGEKYSRAIAEIKQDLSKETCDVHWQLALNLLGRSEDPCVLTGQAFDEAEKLALFRDTNNLCELAFLYIAKMALSYLFNKDDEALRCADEAEKNLPGVTGMMVVPIFHFYSSLLILRRHRQGLAADPELGEVETHQEKMRLWASHAPENFEHKALLVSAEHARAVGQRAEARELYDRAILLAHRHGFVNEEALAHELAADFCREAGLAHAARNYLRDAHYAYQLWGAVAKMRDLEEQFPHDLMSPASRSRDLSTRSTTTESSAGELDLRSVLKASQALSEEIVLERLLEKLLRTVLENAGAERAILALDQDGEWVIQAEGEVESEQVRILKGQPVGAREDLLGAAINWVARTGQPEVIEDVSNSERYAKDPYAVHSPSKSVLCMPLVKQGRITAILYLENSLVKAAFTHERIEVLNLLSAEMAIAIENARLYSELGEAHQELEAYSRTLEEKVKERTRELRDKNSQLRSTLDLLQAAQQQLIQREKMASLGNLTAGIAHEIRNPLNLVNSFAHLTQGLSRDLEEALDEARATTGIPDFDLIEELVASLGANSSRIEKHGKRANAIVDSMLLHTRGGADRWDFVDLNELLARSAQLAYNAIQARGDSSLPDLEERYDASVGKIRLLASDIGRAFINIIENAFQASTSRRAEGGEAGRVCISSENGGETVTVKVRDNGPGVPAGDLDKIFNPFFTTKPPGEGVGLGLSISYDIIVNKHRGDLRVESIEGELTEIVISLPK